MDRGKALNLRKICFRERTLQHFPWNPKRMIDLKLRVMGAFKRNFWLKLGFCHNRLDPPPLLPESWDFYREYTGKAVIYKSWDWVNAPLIINDHSIIF